MGFEPTTSAVTGRRSNQLSHQAIVFKTFIRRIIPSKLHIKSILHPYHFCDNSLCSILAFSKPNLLG